MAYEHKEGKGTLFPNDYKKADTHPDFRGTAKWQGEIIEVSMWTGHTRDGKDRYTISIGYPYKKDGQLSEHDKDKTNGFAPNDRDDKPLPF